jgi:hypothetical protein
MINAENVEVKSKKKKKKKKKITGAEIRLQGVDGTTIFQKMG